MLSRRGGKANHNVNTDCPIDLPRMSFLLIIGFKNVRLFVSQTETNHINFVLLRYSLFLEILYLMAP